MKARALYNFVISSNLVMFTEASVGGTQLLAICLKNYCLTF